MLRQHVEPAFAKRFAIALTVMHRIERGGRFEEFEPVARYQHRPAGLVEPVIGAPDPLQQAA